jgi:preprotein translocase subunit SecB
MAEPVPPTAAAGQGDAPSLAINAQYVKDLSFENPRAPQVLGQGAGPPQVQVKVNVSARQIGEKLYESVLEINAEAKAGAETAFVVELSYGGLFTITGLTPEQLRPVLLIEGPRLLFPFAREIIATATQNGGFPPLLINPVDFLALYRQQAGPQAGATPPPPSA